MRIALVIGLLLAGCPVAVRGEEGAKGTPKPPELKVLDRLLGSWNVECTEKEGERETRITGTATTEWILGGHFLQWKGTRNPGGIENTQIIGFDPVKKQYTMWYFDSAGISVGPVGGQWDENEKTLTWRGTFQDDVSFVNRERFVDSDTTEWHFTVSRTDGTVLFEQQGKSTRKK